MALTAFLTDRDYKHAAPTRMMFRQSLGVFLFLLATVGNIAYHGRGPARLLTSPIYFNVSSTYGEL